jgi:hypothetical protein
MQLGAAQQPPPRYEIELADARNEWWMSHAGSPSRSLDGDAAFGADTALADAKAYPPFMPARRVVQSTIVNNSQHLMHMSKSPACNKRLCSESLLERQGLQTTGTHELRLESSPSRPCHCARTAPSGISELRTPCQTALFAVHCCDLAQGQAALARWPPRPTRCLRSMLLG